MMCTPVQGWGHFRASRRPTRADSRHRFGAGPTTPRAGAAP